MNIIPWMWLVDKEKLLSIRKYSEKGDYWEITLKRKFIHFTETLRIKKK